MSAKPNPFTKFLNLLVLAVLGYAVLSSFFSSTHKTATVASGNGLYAEKPRGGSQKDDWSKLIGLVGNALQPVLKIVSDIPGAGSPVVCGQQVTYRYTDKAIGADTAFVQDKTVSFRLGREPVIEGHLRALADMKPGGERVVQFASQWGYGDSGPEGARGADIESHIRLISAVPTPPVFTMPLRVFFRTPHNALEDTFKCGQSVKAKLSFWAMDGTKLFPPGGAEPEFMTVTTGQGNLPLGLETVLQKISPGETVTAILPPELTGVFNPGDTPEAAKKPLGSISFPKKQAIMVDIEAAEAISTADEAAAPKP